MLTTMLSITGAKITRVKRYGYRAILARPWLALYGALLMIGIVSILYYLSLEGRGHGCQMWDWVQFLTEVCYH